MRFVDTHCHLYYRPYQQDYAEVVRRANAAGVETIIVPGLDLPTSQAAIRLAEEFDGVYAAVGVHPGDVDSFRPEQMAEFNTMLLHPKVIAVGEIGLDYYHRKDNLQYQKDVCNQFLQLALDHHKPVILHSRECLIDLIALVQPFQQSSTDRVLSGVFHSFEGDLRDAEVVKQLGFFIGVCGPVTYKKAHIKHELFSKIDLSKVLLETDGPFLPPHPFRGQRNEPGYIPLIAEKIAELQLCDIKDVANQTTRNVENLFFPDQLS